LCRAVGGGFYGAGMSLGGENDRPARSGRDGEPLRGFADRLRRLQRDCGGWSVRELAFRMRSAGTPFARSTINDKLTGVSRPSWEFVEAFVTACACGTAGMSVDLGEWRSAYGQLLRDLAAVRTGQRRGTRAYAELAGSAASTSDGAATRPVPRQLPPVVGSFIGRAGELARLDCVRQELSLAGATMSVCVIAGTPGVGKTTLALYWARRVADRFPDGQLYVNLRGFDPGGQATDPGAVIRGFLDALAPDLQLPADAGGQTGLYRSLLTGRRVLIVLDNARDTDQVRPLLPGSPGCMPRRFMILMWSVSCGQ
jgi:hypothetical protein